MKKRSNQDFLSVGEILKKFDPLKDKYISREFQYYGYKLAEELNDLEHKALYIKLAKELPRAILEEARNFVKDASNVKNPAKLFMWKLKNLKSKTRLPDRQVSNVKSKSKI
jgi:hypothetical protein